MSNEELMRPRYKVINIWPDMADRKYAQGQIITLDQVDDKTAKKQSFLTNKEGKLYDAFFDMFPHLFKKLEWWEERKIEEMPEYVKNVNEVAKVHKYIAGGKIMEFANGTLNGLTNLWLPATAAEYEQYINQKEKQ